MRLFTFCLCLLLMGTSVLSAQNKSYHIKVKLDGYKNDTCILGYRLGSKTYVKDTVVGKNKKGYFEFKKDTLLEGGVYIILMKPENYNFEFLVPLHVCGTLGSAVCDGFQSATFKARNNFGTESDPATTTETAEVHNATIPSISFGAALYPNSQGAIKATESATVENVVVNQDVIE